MEQHPLELVSGSRQSLGVAVIFGLVFSTGLTLYVVPAMYSTLARRRETAAGAAALAT